MGSILGPLHVTEMAPSLSYEPVLLNGSLEHPVSSIRRTVDV